jgi:hypothetical protein
MTFLETFDRYVPSWLSDGEGGLVLGSLALMVDAAIDRCRQGLEARMPSRAPDDAMQWIGRDRKITRGINESKARYAARLIRWLDDHRVRGNPYALHDQLRAYMQVDVMVRTVDRRGNWFTTSAAGVRSVSINAANWNWDGVAASSWSRFWVIIYPTAAGLPWSPSVGDAGGASWPVGGTIGTTATPDDVNCVRSIIKDWKPAGTFCEWIIVAFDPASFDPAAPVPDGTWEHFGYDDAGNYYVARLESARFWKGVDGA